VFELWQEMRHGFVKDSKIRNCLKMVSGRRLNDDFGQNEKSWLAGVWGIQWGSFAAKEDVANRVSFNITNVVWY